MQISPVPVPSDIERDRDDPYWHAIWRSQPVVEFDLDGHVTDVNDNFLRVMGYDRQEVIGQHHRIFCDETYVGSRDYDEFWRQLRAGQNFSGEFRRFGKGGRKVWVQASYSPILDRAGRPRCVVKCAADVTAERLRALDHGSKVAAIDRSQAVIEFDMQGRVVQANRNFLGLMGYTAEEVMGQHHSMFCAPDHVTSTAYRDFWRKLAEG